MPRRGSGTDHGQGGQGWGGGEAEHDANKGTAELACAAEDEGREVRSSQ